MLPRGTSKGKEKPLYAPFLRPKYPPPHANKQYFFHPISPFSRLSTPGLQPLRSACNTEVIYRAVVVCSQSTTASHSNDYWFGVQTTTGLHPIPVVVCTSTTTPLRWSLLSPVTLPPPKNAFPHLSGAEDIAYLCSGKDDTRSLPYDNEWYDPLYR